MPYYIPRNTKGEGRILYVFSTKGLIYTVVGAAIGFPFYYVLNQMGLTYPGIAILIIFALIGFAIATFKVPEIKSFDFTKKTGGLSIDQVILTAIKFKKNKKIYVYDDIDEIREETKDE